MLLEQREMLRAGQRRNGAVTAAALGLLFQPGNPAPDPSFLFLLIQIQLACFFWDTFDPGIEKRGNFERGRIQTVVCCRTCCFVATWEQLLGELTPCLVVESVRKAGWHRGVKYRAVAEQGNGPCRRFMRENGSSESRERVGNGRLAGRLKSRIGDSHCQPGSQHQSRRKTSTNW